MSKKQAKVIALRRRDVLKIAQTEEDTAGDLMVFFLNTLRSPNLPPFDETEIRSMVRSLVEAAVHQALATMRRTGVA